LRRNLARFQRTSESAGKSTGGRRDNIVERGGTRLNGTGLYLIMLGDFVVDAKDHRCGFRGQIGFADRAFDPFNSDL
jgi:hypothetical protein